MAAALLDHHARGRVHSRINPAVEEAMAEIGIDLSDEFPLTDDPDGQPLGGPATTSTHG